MRRGDSIYRPKPRAKQIDEFIHHVAVEGAPDPVAAAQRLKALGPLSPAEKQRIARGTRQQSGRTQARVSHRMGQAFSAVTLPLTGQTASETRRVVAKNLSRGEQPPDFRKMTEAQRRAYAKAHPPELSIGMAAWVPGGNPLRRAGARVWNNGRLVEKAERAAKSSLAHRAAEGAPWDIAAVEGLPPVKRGHVRLWRGEGRGSPNQSGDWQRHAGRWFHPSPDVAVGFAYGDTSVLTSGIRPTLKYVDVPASVAREAARHPDIGKLGGEAGEVILPVEWARAARVSEGRLSEEALLAAVRRDGPRALNGLPWLDRATRDELVRLSGWGSPEQKVFGALPAAKKLQREQESLRKAERARRGEAQQRVAERVGGIEGHRLALQELKGELPKLQFGALRGGTLSHGEVQKLLNHINDHPELHDWEKLNAREALLNIVEGRRAPRPSEIKWMERLFGPEKAAEVADPTNWKRLSESGINLVNVPRAMKSSYDVSASFRQNLLFYAAHPIKASRNALGGQRKALFSEAEYEARTQALKNRPNAQAGRYKYLAMTDMENIATREEAFIGANYAERINPGVPGHKRLQVPIGRGVRASGRAYTLVLNESRADWMDEIVEIAKKEGIDIDDPEFIKWSNRFVNSATGRGNLGHFEEALKYLNVVFFSPRLIASRLNFLLNPKMYVGRGDARRIARREARKAARNLLAAGGSILFLADRSGLADVGMDPRSSDFGKIKVGDTRIDIWGGFQQYVVAAARILSGEKVSSTSGDVSRVVDEQEGADNLLSRGWDVTREMAQNKYAPVPSYINQYRKGRTFDYEEFNPWREGVKLFAPLGFENAYETLRQEGPGPAALGLGLGSIGFGVQTYKNTEPKKKGKSRGSRGGGNSIYRGGGGSNSGSIYRR